jgi:hypothetical protein
MIKDIADDTKWKIEGHITKNISVILTLSKKLTKYILCITQ